MLDVINTMKGPKFEHGIYERRTCNQLKTQSPFGPLPQKHSHLKL